MNEDIQHQVRTVLRESELFQLKRFLVNFGRNGTRRSKATRGFSPIRVAGTSQSCTAKAEPAQAKMISAGMRWTTTLRILAVIE